MVLLKCYGPILFISCTIAHNFAFLTCTIRNCFELSKWVEPRKGKKKKTKWVENQKLLLNPSPNKGPECGLLESICIRFWDLDLVLLRRNEAVPLPLLLGALAF